MQTLKLLLKEKILKYLRMQNDEKAQGIQYHQKRKSSQ